ncbi:hypothetical protein FRC08_011054 [Ceratobasidium sp. 394]|nr:hypothetical protein FRC08_011054 [Ceratobasidium sp. 394]
MPPSSLPTPAEPPLMSVFDHSSASSGHAPIQIQIHDALLGEDAGGTPVVYAGGHLAHGHGHNAPPPAPPAPPPPEVPLTGPAAPVPPPFIGALPLPQVPEEEIVVDDMERLYFNLFVHCKALRGYADREENESPAATLVPPTSDPSTPASATSISVASSTPRIRPHRPRVYEWDDWAPPIARLLTRMPMPAWACISHGQRFATLGAVGFNMNMTPPENAVDGAGVPSANENGAEESTANLDPNVDANAALPANVNQPANPPPIDPNFLLDGGPGGINVKRPVRVLDFNQYGVRRNKDKDLSGRNKVTVVDYPTVLPAGKYWERDVKSALPYREVVTQDELLLSGVMIDGERVLGMRVSLVPDIFLCKELILLFPRVTSGGMYPRCMSCKFEPCSCTRFFVPLLIGLF